MLCVVFGLACHIGVQLKLPSVGVAKTLYHVDGIENNEDHHQKVCHLMSSNIGITSCGALGHVPPRLTIYFFTLFQAIQSMMQSLMPIAKYFQDFAYHTFKISSFFTIQK